MTPQQESEATLFAMELLMPAEFVKSELKKMKAFDIAEDKPVRDLAKIFKVPASIMAIRLGQLMERGDLREHCLTTTAP